MKFIIRFDDVNEHMDWSRFEKIKKQLELYKIKAVLGVVPECRDSTLNVGQHKSNYINYLLECKKYGDTIAQHGTYHLYTTKDSGILKINKISEFAGHTFDYQFKLIAEGKRLLMENNLWQDTFMAPGHSFDIYTLKALEELEFKYITDGYGLYPYKFNGLTLVPSLFSKPIGFGFGVYTICLHVNSMSDFEVAKILKFINLNHEKFIDFKDVSSYSKDGFLIKFFLNQSINLIIRCLRYIRSK